MAEAPHSPEHTYDAADQLTSTTTSATTTAYDSEGNLFNELRQGGEIEISP